MRVFTPTHGEMSIQMALRKYDELVENFWVSVPAYSLTAELERRAEIHELADAIIHRLRAVYGGRL